MAELFLAKDTERDELVVIKRILPYLSHEAEFVGMFLDEARIAAQLHHPNIITLHELGKLENQIFIAMEFVEGVDLRRILQEEMKVDGAVPCPVAAFITAQVCAGLHYAHHRTGLDGKPMGIVHRDVSPQNVMVSYGGEVKLVDFGIAKASALVERSKPGVIKGKFLYLSPEQLSQEGVDHRADLFALGTMMYEVTTAKSPFYKPTTEAVIYAIRAEDPPPPHLVRPDFPRALSAIVMKCLAKDRRKRYQDASEVRRDLEAYLAAEHPVTREDVAGYVARLFGTEDERTVLHIPAPNLPPAKPALRAVREGDRPTPPKGLGPALPTEPPTSRERPAQGETLPDEDDPTLALVRKPEVKKGLPYPPAGDDSDPTTTTGREAVPTRPLSALDPEADSEPSLTPSIPTHTGPLVLAPSERLPHEPTQPLPTGEAALDPLGSDLIEGAPEEALSEQTPIGDAEDDRSTKHHRPKLELPADIVFAVKRLLRNPLWVGAIAFGLVVLLGVVLLALWLGGEEPQAGPRVVSPLSPPPPVPEADAGAAALVAPAPTPDEPPLPSGVGRVAVKFKAPPGTRITRDNRERYMPGITHYLLPGDYRITYRCPKRGSRKAQEVNYSLRVPPAPTSGETVEVPLPCR